jgi:hypothetical protein
MNVSRFIQGLVITGIGLGVGIFMAFILVSTGWLNKWVFWTPRVSFAYEIIHLPAWGLFYVWHGLVALLALLDLPIPDECHGPLTLPGAVVAQWVLVGLGVAVWWYLTGS